MPKYLRDFECRFGIGSSFPSWREDVVLDPRMSDAPIRNIRALYRRLVLPVPSSRMAKLNVCLSLDGGFGEPFEVLNVGYVWQPFDQSAFLQLGPAEQQRSYLDTMHTAAMRAAASEGWEPARFETAHAELLRSHFTASFLWKKPITSPDRKHKAQIAVEMTATETEFYLVFFDRRLQSLQRVLLVRSQGEDPGNCFSSVGWRDDRTVKVGRECSSMFWEVNVDGGLRFRSPKAEAGDAQAMYALGLLHYQGGVPHKDEPRGLELIQAAAALGYKHAHRFIERLQQR